MEPEDLELRALTSSARVCPYCKDGLGEVELIECPSCKTRMHRECFGENGGCTSLGCGVQSRTWPRCPRCEVRLARQSAVVCIHCGLNLESGESYPTPPEDPGIYWVMPRWTGLTEAGRRRRREAPRPLSRRARVTRGLVVAVGAALFVLPLIFAGAEDSGGAAPLFALFPAWVLFIWVFRRRRGQS